MTVDKRKLAQMMLDWEQYNRHAIRLEREIKDTVRCLRETVVTGNVIAIYADDGVTLERVE